jgi:hypothetical protein
MQARRNTWESAMNIASRRVLAGFFLLALFLTGLPRATAVTRAQPAPVTSHPRRWLTGDDLPRLGGWATDANPLWLDRPGGQSLHELKVMAPDGASFAMIATDVDVEEIGCGG